MNVDLAMLVVSFFATAAAIAGAIVAFVQARSSLRARDDAREAEVAAVSARDAAVRAQQDSALAAVRIAEVLEQQAAAQSAAAAVRPDPWEVRPGDYVKHGGQLYIVHVGSGAIEDVSIEVERRPYMLHIDPQPVPTSFVPGDAVKITWTTVGADPSMPTVVVRWRWADSGEVQTTRAPLA